MILVRMNIMYCTNMEQIINAMQGIKDEIKKLSVATTPPKIIYYHKKGSFVCSGSFNILESLNKKFLTIHR